jgi:polygalacturonase
VTLTGDITFSTGVHWNGTLFWLSGGEITFDGGGHTINGNGQWYCE